MKKIILCFLFCFVAIVIATGPHLFAPPFLTPQTAIEKEENKIDAYIHLSQYLTQKDYDKAFNLLFSSSCDTFFLNKEMVDHITKRYKKMLTIKATAYLKNNQPNEALALLKEKQTFYLNDAEYQNLYQTAQYQTKKIDWVKYTGTIPILSLNPLISKPKLNIGDSQSIATDAYEDYLTPNEFRNILTMLYNNNYILVDIFDVLQVTNQKVNHKELYLPQGKIPVILTIKNVVYNKEQKSKGTVDKLIIDRKQRLATYTSKKAIQDRVSYNDEFCTILEDFLSSHPEFSHNGARVIIGLTGEDGILGYRTQKTNANSRFDIKKALQVVTKLKKLGYRFASMGYSDVSINHMNTLERNKDLYNWQEEVGKIVGLSPLYILPSEEEPSKEILQSLAEYGYYILIGNTLSNTNQMPLQIISAKTIKENRDELSPFFDTRKVLEEERQR